MTKQILTHNYSTVKTSNFKSSSIQVFTLRPRMPSFVHHNSQWKEMNETNNDPSAGSPTETLLRLLLPLNDQVWSSSKYARQLLPVAKLSVRLSHWTIQSVVATGGVYKGQGRNQRKLMTCAYWEFLVQGKQLQFPIPSTSRVQRITSTFRTWIKIYARWSTHCSARAAPNI